eukprot:TRINITY_DN50120_c0_g1_i1.p1 TRINITY_DN50120_c0_g1~~TRINITY_DN50120_c0_g1_i1.p1  ORF type:complete len:223 (+),score=42.05 TRINITY_DN50120_c0_g1_i1:70-738(+)
MPRSAASSFYLDCSAGSIGIPEGLDPPLRCQGLCRTHTEECASMRRALDNKEMVSSKFLCFGERVFVHHVEGDTWMRCCVTGDPGKEKASCEALYQPPPPVPEETSTSADAGSNKGLLGKMKSFAKKAGKAVMKLVMPGCGKGCHGDGVNFPAPVCLKDPTGLKGHCVYWGYAGEVHPNHPTKGPRKYKVIQMSVPLDPGALGAAVALVRGTNRLQKGYDFL